MPPAPRKTDDTTPQQLPPTEAGEQEYFQIARRQSEALNTLDERTEGLQERILALEAVVQQTAFRLQALEEKPPAVDYGPDPNAERTPIRRRPTPLCDQCGAAEPAHFDHCPRYVTPKDRAA